MNKGGYNCEEGDFMTGTVLIQWQVQWQIH